METVTVAQALAELPTESADAVAEFLRDKGIKGRPMSWTDCPIAHWIRSRTGGLHGPKFEVITSGTIEIREPVGVTRHFHSEAVEEFIRAFDGPFNPYSYLIG
jgi:hypothetical protein